MTTCNNSHCQAHLLADLLTIPLMYNLVLWKNFLKKNSDIWHIPNLSAVLKNYLMAAAAALKICMSSCNYLMLYENLRKMNESATPEKIIICKHALLLHKSSLQ